MACLCGVNRRKGRTEKVLRRVQAKEKEPVEAVPLAYRTAAAHQTEHNVGNAKMLVVREERIKTAPATWDVQRQRTACGWWCSS
jgi:hypothetical protein